MRHILSHDNIIVLYTCFDGLGGCLGVGGGERKTGLPILRPIFTWVLLCLLCVDW